MSVCTALLGFSYSRSPEEACITCGKKFYNLSVHELNASGKEEGLFASLLPGKLLL